jgi:RNA polymerase sigma-70 factor (ECF subfamily)
LFEAHHLAVYRFLLHMTRQREDAEDLTQDVFLRVVRGIAGYERRGLDRAWLFTIARNLLADRRRSVERRPEIDAGIPPDALPATGAAPVDALVLNQALASLPELDREVLLLREMSGLTYAEIAAITGTTLDAVAARLYRARMALRSALGTPSTHRAVARECST